MRRATVAVVSDVDDVTVVQQPVDERRGHHLVAEYNAPLLEALIDINTVDACSWRALINWKNNTAPSSVTGR